MVDDWTNDKKVQETKIEITIEANSVDKLRIMLCDDEPEQLLRMEQALEVVDVELERTSFSSALELLQALQNKIASKESLPQVIFSDIEMPDYDGISLGKEIHKILPDCYLIFTTAYVEYAVKGYEARAYRYLLKPVTAEKVREVLKEIQSELHGKKKLVLKNQEGKRVIAVEDIIYLSAEDKYTILYTKQGQFMDRTSLNQYEELLVKHGFFRNHRKYLVNTAYHQSFNKGMVELVTGDALPLSRRKESKYKARLLYIDDEDMLR